VLLEKGKVRVDRHASIIRGDNDKIEGTGVLLDGRVVAVGGDELGSTQRLGISLLGVGVGDRSDVGTHGLSKHESLH
jgi:hypothetical protein